MRQDTEIVERRPTGNPTKPFACVATIEAFTLDDFKTLPDSLQWEIIENAVQRWKDHVLPRETKEAGFVNDGKTFTLKSIAEDLARSPSRSSGPSDKDRETGKTLATALAKNIAIPKLPADAPQADIDANRALAKQARQAALQDKYDAQKKYRPWIQWEWDDAKSFEENCTFASHAIRQPEPRQKAPKAPKWI